MREGGIRKITLSDSEWVALFKEITPIHCHRCENLLFAVHEVLAQNGEFDTVTAMSLSTTLSHYQELGHIIHEVGPALQKFRDQFYQQTYHGPTN